MGPTTDKTWRIVPVVGKLLLAAACAVVVASIAFPGEHGWSRIAPNEVSATKTIRKLNEAEERYASRYGIGFTDTLGKLGPPSSGQPSREHAGLVKVDLAGNGSDGPATFSRNGYVFRYTPGTETTGRPGEVRSYAINADPISRGSSGQRSFYSDQSGVIRANAIVPASASDAPI